VEVRLAGPPVGERDEARGDERPWRHDGHKRNSRRRLNRHARGGRHLVGVTARLLTALHPGAGAGAVVMTGMPARARVCVRRMSRRGAIGLAHRQSRWRASDGQRKQKREEPPHHGIHCSAKPAGPRTWDPASAGLRSVVRLKSDATYELGTVVYPSQNWISMRTAAVRGGPTAVPESSPAKLITLRRPARLNASACRRIAL
jgi:hypothetical protein